MGWMWWKDDPLEELDPSLRAYLDRQAPRASPSAKAAPGTSPSPAAGPSNAQDSAEQTSWRSYLGLNTDNSNYIQAKTAKPTAPEQSASSSDAVPAESLFQDGRYAHIWKSYRPAHQVEDAGKSDQERLMDIVHAYRDRQADLNRAALENCSLQQLAVHECFQSGSWSSRMTMCRAETRELQACTGLQTKFLKALGYLDMHNRPEEETERMQMHADKLYQKLKEQERAIDDARAKGEPLPDFAPLIRHKGEALPAAADDYLANPSTTTFESLPEDLQDKFNKGRLAGLQGPQLELAKREVEQEIAAHTQLYERVGEHARRERREQLERLAAGKERLSDKVKRYFDFRDYSKVDALEAEEREAQRQRAQALQDSGR